MQGSARLSKILQDLARVCNHSQVIKQIPYCKKLKFGQQQQQQQTQELEMITHRLKILPVFLRQLEAQDEILGVIL